MNDAVGAPGTCQLLPMLFETTAADEAIQRSDRSSDRTNNERLDMQRK